VKPEEEKEEASNRIRKRQATQNELSQNKKNTGIEKEGDADKQERNP